MILDLDGYIVSWNAGTDHVNGYRASEFLGHHFSIFYPAEDVSAGNPERELRSAAEHGRFVSDSWRVRKDGSRFCANVTITPTRDVEGNLSGFVKLTLDVTNRKRTEEALRRSRETFRLVVEAAPNAMVMVNAQGQIEMVNALTEKIFGYRRTELLGQTVEILVPERFRGQHPALRRDFFADPTARPMGAGRDLFGLRKDGSEFPVEIGINPIETDEGTMVLSAIVDISDRKHKEERLQAALREKDVLLGEIHHRVKNNLQIVHSLLDLQSTRIADPTALDLIRESRNRISSMALIYQVLYQSNDFALVDFSAVLEVALLPTLLESYSLGEQDITFDLRSDKVQLPLNTAIPCGLIVNELISNALKYAYPGNQHGDVRIELGARPNYWVFLSVSDDGIGLPVDLDLAKAPTLGLQLVQLLTEQMGGILTINRAAPTVFAIDFPEQKK